MNLYILNDAIDRRPHDVLLETLSCLDEILPGCCKPRFDIGQFRRALFPEFGLRGGDPLVHQAQFRLRLIKLSATDLHLLAPLGQLLARVVELLARHGIAAAQLLHAPDLVLEIGQFCLYRIKRCLCRLALGHPIGALALEFANTVDVRPPLALHQGASRARNRCRHTIADLELRRRERLVRVEVDVRIGGQHALQARSRGAGTRELPLQLANLGRGAGIFEADQGVTAADLITLLDQHVAHHTLRRCLDWAHARIDNRGALRRPGHIDSPEGGPGQDCHQQQHQGHEQPATRTGKRCIGDAANPGAIGRGCGICRFAAAAALDPVRNSFKPSLH
jgi:hypothetical protein